MATDVERLIVTLEASLTKFNRQMATVGDTADRRTKEATGKATQNLKAMEDRAAEAARKVNQSLDTVGRSGSNVGRQLQNAAFQAGDFFVQISSGTNAMRAAAQQLPQLLGGFGVWGAVAGAAVAALSSIVGSMDLFGEKSKETADNYKKFLDTADGTKEIADAAAEGITTLTIKLAQMDDVARKAFAASLRQKISEETDQLQSAVQTMSDKLKGVYDTLFDPSILQLPDFDRVQGQFESIFAVLQHDPGDPAAWNNLATAVRDLANWMEQTNPAARDAIKQLNDFADTLDDNAGKARAVAESVSRHREELRLTQGDAEAGAAGLRSYSSAAGEVLASVTAAANGIKYLRSQFGRLSTEGRTFASSKSVNFGFVGLGQDQIRDSLAANDKFRLDNIYGADTEYNPASVALYGDTKPKKGKGGGGKKQTPEDRADKRTQQIKDEIAYNQQLAAVYALGEEAVRKVTAAYEALKAVRQSGLKEGSVEFENAVKQQTAENLVNLELENRLDLLKQGKALHESLMTDQEKQAQQLALYDKMLKANAISTTDYERAVAKAKSQNDSLAESIGAIGDAFTAGIQGATSFSDALLKIGMQLLNLAAKGLFGQGPLGGLFNNLFGVVSGGILGVSASSSSGAAAKQGVTNGTGFRRSFAGGGMAGPGVIRVGESGPELLSLSQRGHVTPAAPTRRLLGGAGSSSGPVEIYVSGARGNAEIEAMVAAGVARGVKTSRASVGPDYENYRIRFGGRGR